jgi:hypothetical protein
MKVIQWLQALLSNVMYEAHHENKMAIDYNKTTLDVGSQ